MHLALVLVLHYADGIIIGAFPFLRSRLLKWGAAWLFGHVLHWYWQKQHVIQMVLQNALLHLLGQADLNEVQCGFSGHGMPLALMLASCDSIRIVKGTTTFLTSRQSKWGETWLFALWHSYHCMRHHLLLLVLLSHDTTVINASVTWCLQHHKWNHYILGQDKRSNFLVCVMLLALASAPHDADGIFNSTITFLRSRWSK